MPKKFAFAFNAILAIPDSSTETESSPFGLPFGKSFPIETPAKTGSNFIFL